MKRQSSIGRSLYSERRTHEILNPYHMFATAQRINLSTINQRPPAEQSWGYEDGPWKGPGPPLLGAADLQIYPISFYFGEQRGVADFQKLCRPGAITAGFSERLGDELFFHNFLRIL